METEPSPPPLPQRSGESRPSPAPSPAPSAFSTTSEASEPSIFAILIAQLRAAAPKLLRGYLYVVIAVATLLILVFWAVAGYVYLYNYYIPANVATHPLKFDYSTSAFGIEKATPSASASALLVLSPNIEYDIRAELRVPCNQPLTSAMLQLLLDGQEAARASASATGQCDIRFQILHAAVWWPWYLLEGRATPARVAVPLLDRWNPPQACESGCVLEAVLGSPLEVLPDSRLVAVANLRSFRYFMYQYRTAAFLVGVASFFTIEVLVCLLVAAGVVWLGKQKQD